jgi:geranylgeranyl diphosphate synthase type I
MDKRFTQKLGEYKQAIDADIAGYCDQLNTTTSKNYGQSSLIVSQAYTDILKRGGKRIRGALTLVGYEMCGGQDREMIILAARAVEMMHAYLLIIDDIQDNSEVRRGGPSAHKLLESVHRAQKWRGTAEHIGTGLALNAALLGLHSAEMVLANLAVEDELKVKALNIMNHTMAVTSHGQTHDIINQIAADTSLEEVESIMQWKSAHYSFLNPIHTGMVLAGAPCEDTNAITQYALNLGKAFQIADDLLVVDATGSSGKNPIDDLREGKRTLLTVYALENAKTAEAAFLDKCLGDPDLSERDFEHCRVILVESGAAGYAKKTAEQYIAAARKSLKQHAGMWDDESVLFLDQLAGSILQNLH